MAGSPWRKTRNILPEQTPHARVISSGDLFVCNSDALVVAADIDDPIQMYQSGEGAAIRPFAADGYAFFDLFLIVGNATTAPTIPHTTACKVRAFGRPAYNNQQNGAHLLPSDFNSTVFDALASAAVDRGYPVPLFSATGLHEQTFVTTPEINSDSVATKRFQITAGEASGGGVSYFTRGCNDIIVLISQALAQTNATAAMILASLGTN